jgi:hypothetical protein
MLTDEEFEANIKPDLEDMARLNICADILNKREALPAKYKELVRDYAGSKNADPDVEINL